MSAFEDYAVLVLCAGDVDQIWHNLGGGAANPVLPPAGAPKMAYITAQYWDALGQMRCDDIYVLKQQNCYYGLLLRCKAAVGPFKPGDYLVAVRGTMNPLEWANDATAEIPDYQPPIVGGLATGFWKVYTTMTFNDMAGGNANPQPAAAIAAIVKAHPTGRVFVTGHSLGAAIATYLTADLRAQLGPATDLQPYFFASPKVGTQDYCYNYQQSVPAYTLVNFAADLVPMLPSSPPFVALNGGGPTHDVHTIARNTPDAPPFPQLDLGKNHSPAYYALMLDPANAVARALLPP